MNYGCGCRGRSRRSCGSACWRCTTATSRRTAAPSTTPRWAPTPALLRSAPRRRSCRRGAPPRGACARPPAVAHRALAPGRRARAGGRLPRRHALPPGACGEPARAPGRAARHARVRPAPQVVRSTQPYPAQQEPRARGRRWTWRASRARRAWRSTSTSTTSSSCAPRLLAPGARAAVSAAASCSACLAAVPCSRLSIAAAAAGARAGPVRAGRRHAQALAVVRAPLPVRASCGRPLARGPHSCKLAAGLRSWRGAPGQVWEREVPHRRPGLLRCPPAARPSQYPTQPCSACTPGPAFAGRPPARGG